MEEQLQPVQALLAGDVSHPISLNKSKAEYCIKFVGECMNELMTEAMLYLSHWTPKQQQEQLLVFLEFLTSIHACSSSVTAHVPIILCQ